MYLLYFALLVAATSAAPTCKCEDEDKVKVKILISVIIYINPQLCSLPSRTCEHQSFSAIPGFRRLRCSRTMLKGFYLAALSLNLCRYKAVKRVQTMFF